ncbi:hypothetical protein V6042_23550, partial [Klebsiella pneumoniae]
ASTIFGVHYPLRNIRICQTVLRRRLRLGRGYSYEIIRAKTLYSKEARKVGSGIRAGRGKVEYGPHIPTLLKQAEGGELD